MNKYHIAQINIAKAKAEMDSDIMLGFVERLDEINSLADESPGFVWRLQSEDGDSTAIRVFDDPLLLINMSVWEDIESLKTYVYRTAHVDLIRDRDAWFNKTQTAHQALWWVSPGHIPSLEEGKSKLDLLNKQGPSSDAFTFAKPFALNQTNV
ncbi:DUF3291 domain-containing protein [Halioxenophilus sp. WMMB6]|uniref:DUF3291 domain-containing protein n=1 Tax=Halioxenophilus sp. WMMB6 TaxID=3073815 RepID=UPI00295EDB55|nr:DUF3291 domain-containing protein [Halioxenophilus sp. WMMB6]